MTDKRIFAHIKSDPEAPLIIVVAGLHGNETAGIEAVRNIKNCIDSHAISFDGELIALYGNMKAIKENRRFIEKDLNRLWQKQYFDKGKKSGLISELKELYELYEVIQPYFNQEKREIYLLDLHSSSSDSLPFLCFKHDYFVRSLLKHFPIPKIIGLVESLNGTLIEYVQQYGIKGVCLEAGQHHSPDTVKSSEAFLWLFLSEANFISKDEAFVRDAKKTLHDLALYDNAEYEIIYRHGLGAHDEFMMKQGFKTFDYISKGEFLARDRYGDIFSHTDGHILLPLYQVQGEDGFFLSKKL